MLHLGPFAKCKRAYTTVEIEILGCKACNTSKHWESHHYCPECGSAFAVTGTEPENTDTIDAFDLTERMNEALCHYHLNEDVTLYLPNRERGSARKMDMKSEYQRMSDSVIHDELQWFQSQFKDEIAVLKREYGDSVEIAWGFVRISD